MDHIIPELEALQAFPDFLLRPIQPRDGIWVARWRNTELARSSFFDAQVVTPETHKRWLAQKGPYDQVWLLYDHGQVIGMTGLIIDLQQRTGEYGRLFIDERHQGRGLAARAEYSLLWAAFEYYNLNWLWLEARTSNEAVITLHRKTGWLDQEVKEHPPYGPVLIQHYYRRDWVTRRQLVQAQYHVEWEPWE